MQFESEAKAIDHFATQYTSLKKEIAKVIVGQDEVIDQVLVSIFSQGHSLLVGVPGLAKTMLVNTIAEVLGLQFSRIQFTPDLMPSDIVGAEVLDESRAFKFIKGPVFTNILLADEINRTPPKTQAALLEAMQEKAVTAAGKTYKLDKPFFVLATQNPIEQEGTYPLPEAQLDRFMFNIWVDYPTFEEELNVVKNTTSDHSVSLSNVMTQEEILFFQDLVRKMPIADNVIEYCVRLASSTRPNDGAPEIVKEYLSWGAGPRASQYLVIGAKCHAMTRGKYSPDMEDVNAVALPILRHRIVRNFKAETEGYSVEKIIDSLINK